GEVVSTDVLIIGGGIAGLLATIKAALTRPVSVLLVDRATPGFAGQGPFIGGQCGCTPEGILDDWLKWRVEIGGYLNDQEVTYAYGKAMGIAPPEMLDWGVPLQTDEKGGLDVLLDGSGSRALSPVVRWPSPPDVMRFLRGKARSEGASILPRTMVVELLMEGERVAGAVGFSIDSGQFYILKAKATIIANGACMYRYRTLFQCNCGEGVAMAYNVGAEMRNAEFANTIACSTKDGMRGGHASFWPTENAIGENIAKKYGIKEAGDYNLMAPAVYKEIQEGRGPIYSNESTPHRQESDTRWIRSRKWLRMKERLGLLPDEKVEMILAQSNRQGPIRVDPHCRATLPGLWAVGDASVGGSGCEGALAPISTVGGIGVGLAMAMGYIGGLDAAEYASEAAAPEVDSAQVSRLKEEIFAPLKRQPGLEPSLEPSQAIYLVQEAIMPIKYNYIRSGERMQEALAKVERVKEKLPTLWAKDLHYLVKCHQAASMTLCAEMNYRSALMRKESRGAHMREDYPERDDDNWLKWIIIEKEREVMKMWTEPVPIDKYKIKPHKKA
ncbi:FAD-binding protein, partial [Chloroflexota bacterium]